MKKLFFLTVFISLMTAAVHARVISFYVVETGLPVEGKTLRSSILWENAFLDVFFDAGYIVTNYPIYRLESRPSGREVIEEAGFDIVEARQAGVDYILIAQLDYTSATTGPDEISFFVFKVTNHLVIYEKKLTGRNFKNEKDAVDELKKIVKELVPIISSI